MIAPYKNKPFYGKDWIVPKLNDFLLDNSFALIKEANTSGGNLSNFLVLLGDSGTGKSHLCCELKWPGAGSVFQPLHKQMVGVYFLNWFSPRQNNVRQFSSFMRRAIHEFSESGRVANGGGLFASVQSLDVNEIGVTAREAGAGNRPQLDENYVTDLANEFIVSTLMPLKNVKLLEDSGEKRYFFLIDGIDEAILHMERLQMKRRNESALKLR